MRAGIGLGRALLAQAKTADALKAFEDVQSNDSNSELAESQRVIAKLGKARCLAALKRGDEAVRLAQDIVAKADAKDEALMAEAYVTLGIAFQQANRPKDALLAFLHVDVLYDSVPDLHAEALANLIEVFLELHKPDHAGACRQRLRKEYPNSPWAKQAR
jgi:tetratricopeptide (TPR) repeat protein